MPRTTWGFGATIARGRRTLCLAAAALAAACWLVAPAQARFRLPLYQPLAPVPIVCATVAEWAADPLARQVADEAAYTSLDGDDRIVLSPRTCLALLLLAVDPAGVHDELNEHANLAPVGVPLPVAWAEAQAALALEHEVAHATFRGHDETAAACFARAHAPDVLRRAGASGARYDALVSRVAQAHALLPAVYRQHACP